MNRCIIITGYIEGRIRQILSLQPDDFIICADAGLDLALQENIAPHLFIGDGDSALCDFHGEAIHLPVRKDETDLLYAVKHAIHLGYTDLWIIGGMGGRLDHTVASLQTLSYAHDHKVNARLLDGHTQVYLCTDRLVLTRQTGYTLSLFAWNGPCTGVTLSGTDYPLKNGRLEPSFPLGVSNSITQPQAVIEVQSGALLVICSQDAQKQT